MVIDDQFLEISWISTDSKVSFAKHITNQNTFITFAAQLKIIDTMIQMAAIWIISVVAFFVLWALLASVIRKISEKKDGASATLSSHDNQEQDNQQNIQQ